MAAHFTASTRSRKAVPTVVKQPEITTAPAQQSLTKRLQPYEGFPLSAHAAGYWQKKIRGQLHYFGKWGQRINGKLEPLPGDAGAQAALELFQLQRDDLYAGRTPRTTGEGLTVGDLCNRFLTAKLRRRDAGEITPRSYDEYKATTDRLVATFGKNRLVDDLAANDFEALRNDMTKQWGPVRLGNEVGKVRSVFKYGYEAGVIEKPVRFGPEFKKPSASVLRRHRAKNGKKFLEAAELRKLLDKAEQPLKAMILLGLNCGMGNHDCALLPLGALKLDTGWLDFPRPKTGIERRCPLWPETVVALREVLATRLTPKQEAAQNLLFLTIRGRQWLSRGIANPISVATRDLMKAVGVHRKGSGFYTLRHVFETVASGCRDQVAINAIMGHSDASMAATYREHIDDARLRNVVNHVRTWLFGSAEGGAQ